MRITLLLFHHTVSPLAQLHRQQPGLLRGGVGRSLNTWQARLSSARPGTSPPCFFHFSTGPNGTLPHLHDYWQRASKKAKQKNKTKYVDAYERVDGGGDVAAPPTFFHC